MKHIIEKLEINETNTRIILSKIKQSPDYNKILTYFDVDNAPEAYYMFKHGSYFCGCGNKTKFISTKQGYKKYCSRKCSTKATAKERGLKGWKNRDPNKGKEKRLETLKETLSKRTLEEKEIISKTISEAVKKRNIEHPDLYVKASKTRKETCLKKYGVSHFSKTEEYSRKMRISMVNKGFWTPIESKNDLEIYRRAVWNTTNKQELTTLKNIEKRGKLFHLDHMFSIVEGFRQNIPSYIIGDINNLKILSASENRIKISKCSITKEELLDAIFLP